MVCVDGQSRHYILISRDCIVACAGGWSGHYILSFRDFIVVDACRCLVRALLHILDVRDLIVVCDARERMYPWCVASSAHLEKHSLLRL